MRRFLIVIEKTQTGYSAYSPDLDGCVATGTTKKETEKNMREAIAFHIEGLLHDGISVHESMSYAKYVQVAA